MGSGAFRSSKVPPLSRPLLIRFLRSRQRRTCRRVLRAWDISERTWNAWRGRNKSKSSALNYLLSRPLRTETRSFNTRVRNVGWREIKGAPANPRPDRQPSAPPGQSQPSRVPTFRWEPRPDWPALSDVIGVAPERALPIGWRSSDVRVPQVTGIARWALVVQVESGSGEQQRISVAVRGAPPVYII